MLWVIFDHIFYDAGVLYYSEFSTPIGLFIGEFSRRYMTGVYRSIAHPIIIVLFFSLSGVVARFSKNPLKRAVKIFLYAVALWLVTWIFSIITGLNCTITVGVLYAFAVCSFCSLPFIKYDVKFWISIVIGVVLTTVGLLYRFGVFTFLSKELFFVFYNEIGFTLSEDYFPVLPYLGYYFIGFGIGKILYKEKKAYVALSEKTAKWLSPVTHIGRTSLKRYFSSQVTAIVIFELLILVKLL